MRRLTVLTLAFLSAVLASCGGAETRTTFAPPPPTETHAALAGARCATSSYCTCRPLGGGEGQEETSAVPEGQKRYEFRVQSSTGQVWVTLDGRDQLFKSMERAEDCFYVDLAPGHHTVGLRSKADSASGGGVGSGLAIYEYAPGPPSGPTWYRGFVFQCGVPGPCDKDSLDAWKQQIAKDRRSLTDPCGRSRIQALTWETGRMPDALHPEELHLSFTLNVLKQAPDEAPEAPDCSEI